MPPAEEKPLKICIRGLPADTDHRKLKTDLREHGFDPIFMRHVAARDKGPGIFCVQLQSNPKTSTVYDVKKLLDVPVRVEAWRGRQGPPQCQRCQGFRHSAAECVQEYRCVHCARPHPSKNCNRPYDIPTCANCGGPHAANDLTCPAIRREEIAKAGKVLRTSGYTLATPNLLDESNAPSSLMAEANTKWLTVSQRKRLKRKALKKMASVSNERPQSQLKNLEVEAVADPVMKIPDPVSQETQKLARLSINQPQPPSNIVQMTFATDITLKESQHLQEPKQQVYEENSCIPVQAIREVTSVNKYQSTEQQIQGASIIPKGNQTKRNESTTNPDPVRTKVVTECVLVLQNVLSALQEGHNPVPIILEGLTELCRGV